MVRLWRERREDWLEPMPGVRRRLLSHDDKALLLYVELGPGVEYPAHSHVHTQYGVVLRGGGVIEGDNGLVEVREGDAYYLHSNETHRFKAGPAGMLVLEVFTPLREDLAKDARRPDIE